MKKLFIFFFFIPFIAHAQLPSYPDILKKFFSSYSYQSADQTTGLNFAKKKDGWYVQVIDRITENVKGEQLFWSLENSSFHDIQGMSGTLSKEVANREIEQFITGQISSYSFYGYERCRYYGYNTWATDMIRDFGYNDPRSYPDTLLEGLGRAYSTHSSNFLWYQQGGYQDQNDLTQKKLKPLEKPSPRRMDSVSVNINKAIGVYRILAEKNPGYKTKVGNSGMKVFNELMNGYMQMAMSGYEERAQLFLRSIKPNHAITQIARNFLAACPPHAILFTFGDNDTYPLWYVQERDNYRKDVAVLNSNLLGFAPYVDMVRRKNLVHFKTGPVYYGDSTFLYFLAEGENTNVMDAEAFLDMLLRKKISSAESDQSFSHYPTKNISIKVDREKFSHMSPQPGLKEVIPLRLDKFFTSDQFITLDIILTNLYTRPVFFTGKPELYEKNLQQQGLNYRLLPLNTGLKKENEKISAAITEKILHASIRAVPSNDTRNGIAPDFGGDAVIYNVFINLLLHSDSKEHSRMLVVKLLEEYHGNLPYTNNLYSLAILMIGAGYADEGKAIAEKFSKQLYEDYISPSAIAGFVSKSFAEKVLTELKDSLDKLNVKSEVVESYLDKLK